MIGNLPKVLLVRNSDLGSSLGRLHFHQEQYDLTKELFINPEHGRFDENTKLFARMKHLITTPSAYASVYPDNKPPNQLYSLLYHMDIVTIWYHKHRKNTYT